MDVQLSSNQMVPRGRWVHVAGRIGEERVSLFIDGKEVRFDTKRGSRRPGSRSDFAVSYPETRENGCQAAGTGAGPSRHFHVAHLCQQTGFHVEASGFEVMALIAPGSHPAGVELSRSRTEW